MLIQTPRPSGCTCPCRCAASTNPLADADEGQLSDTGADVRALCTCPCLCTSTVGGEPKCCCVCSEARKDVVVPLGPSLSWLGADLDQLQDVCMEDVPRGAAAAEHTVARNGGEVGEQFKEVLAHTPSEAPSTLQPTEQCSSPTTSSVLLQPPQVTTGNSAHSALPTLCLSAYVCAVNIEPTPPSPPKSELRPESCNVRLPAWLVKLAVGSCKMKCGHRNRSRRRWSTVAAHRSNSSSGAARITSSASDAQATATPAAVSPRDADGFGEVAPKTVRDLSTIAATDVVHAGPAQFMPAMMLPDLRMPLVGFGAASTAAGETPPALAVKLVAAAGAPRPLAVQPPSVRAPLALLQQPARHASDAVRGQSVQGEALLSADVERSLDPFALPAPQTHSLGTPPRMLSRLPRGTAGIGYLNGQWPTVRPLGVPNRPPVDASMRPSAMRPPSGAMRPPRSRTTLPTPPAGSWSMHRTQTAQVPASGEASQGIPEEMDENEWDSICVLVADLAEKAFMRGKTD